MEKLKIKLENCYGIKKLEKEFDFSSTSVNTIYAKNGTMKTSFAKVFKKFENNKQAEIKDEIFNVSPVIADINVDGNDIESEEIFVIKSFENFYESDSIATLLVNDELKRNLETVLKLRDEFFKLLERKSGKKVTKTVQGKRVFELEPTLIKDFNFGEESFLINIEQFEIDIVDYNYDHIQYSSIFDDSVIKKIKSDKFQSKIREFLVKSNEIYDKYHFLDKGKLTLPKLKDIQKNLKNNSFFVKENKILLNGDLEVINLDDMNREIEKIDNELQETREFKEIEKLLSDSKGRVLKDIIETHHDIIEELKVENLDEFRRKLWLSYIKSEKVKFDILKTKYNQLEEQIESANMDDTPWKEAVSIFENRFNVPFKMEIDNLKSSIIGESLPKIVFNFCKDGNFENLAEENWTKLNREELEIADTLSQGERRALYLLNIIFDIEQRKKTNQKTLFIVDDIADSFDYKNKYAIVEYLKEISESDQFNMIILSHNFDFYRTISSRLNVSRKNRFSAIESSRGIEVEQEHYQKQPFEFWKNNLSARNLKESKRNIIALIPFVRNLIEYGIDKKVNDTTIDEDYLFLTNILHLKEITKDIIAKELKKVFKEYIGKDDFDTGINDNDKIYDLIMDTASNILVTDSKLECKIVLSIAIRLKAEEFMKTQISQSSETFIWKERRVMESGNSEEFLNFIKVRGNQTRELFNGYSQIGDKETVKLLDSVNIMTPESIHLNSFMYEPILDMDIVELKNLFNRIISL